MIQNSATTTPTGKGRFKLFNEVAGELRKVVWLSRQEGFYLTALVILLTIVVAIILGAFDFGFSKLAQVVFTGG
jgi:preprotein translocase SecE subunit